MVATSRTVRVRTQAAATPASSVAEGGRPAAPSKPAARGYSPVDAVEAPRTPNKTCGAQSAAPIAAPKLDADEPIMLIGLGDPSTDAMDKRIVTQFLKRATGRPASDELAGQWLRVVGALRRTGLKTEDVIREMKVYFDTSTQDYGYPESLASYKTSEALGKSAFATTFERRAKTEGTVAATAWMRASVAHIDRTDGPTRINVPNGSFTLVGASRGGRIPAGHIRTEIASFELNRDVQVPNAQSLTVNDETIRLILTQEGRWGGTARDGTKYDLLKKENEFTLSSSKSDGNVATFALNHSSEAYERSGVHHVEFSGQQLTESQLHAHGCHNRQSNKSWFAQPATISVELSAIEHAPNRWRAKVGDEIIELTKDRHGAFGDRAGDSHVHLQKDEKGGFWTITVIKNRSQNTRDQTTTVLKAIAELPAAWGEPDAKLPELLDNFTKRSAEPGVLVPPGTYLLLSRAGDPADRHTVEVGEFDDSGKFEVKVGSQAVELDANGQARFEIDGQAALLKLAKGQIHLTVGTQAFDLLRPLEVGESDLMGRFLAMRDFTALNTETEQVASAVIDLAIGDEELNQLELKLVRVLLDALASNPEAKGSEILEELRSWIPLDDTKRTALEAVASGFPAEDRDKLVNFAHSLKQATGVVPKLGSQNGRIDLDVGGANPTFSRLVALEAKLGEGWGELLTDAKKNFAESDLVLDASEILDRILPAGTRYNDAENFKVGKGTFRDRLVEVFVKAAESDTPAPLVVAWAQAELRVAEERIEKLSQFPAGEWRATGEEHQNNGSTQQTREFSGRPGEETGTFVVSFGSDPGAVEVTLKAWEDGSFSTTDTNGTGYTVNIGPEELFGQRSVGIIHKRRGKETASFNGRVVG